MPVSYWARGDSNTANNASLNARGINQQSTTLLTFEADPSAPGGGDTTLDLNNGLPDPDTLVYVNGSTTAISFTVELYGDLPTSNKLSNVGSNNTDLRGEQVYILTLETGERLFVVSSLGMTTTGLDPTGHPDYTDNFNIMDNFPNGAHQLGNVVPCYAAGTLIRTADGQKLVEDIVPGDILWTDDDTLATVRFVSSRKVTAEEMRIFDSLCPLIIPAGSIGPSEPERDLTVTPLHRIRIADGEVHRLFGLDRVFVSAKELPFARVAALEDTTFYHFLCDRHVAVMANGCVSESLYPGDVARMSLSPDDRIKLKAALVPGSIQQTAYPCLTAKEASVWRDAVQRREKRTA
ncbi:MAG: hypothetical protein GKR98_04635 [Boseongicola sp.]|nr:MAG: hypothetical protein GKR98_04635 [Boseongicola sp.]